MSDRRTVIIVTAITILALCTVPAWSVERPFLTEIFNGTRLSYFLKYCTPKCNAKSKCIEQHQCILSSPEDFRKLHGAKQNIRDSIAFYKSIPLFCLRFGLIAVILCLVIHLIVLGHYNWRSLPIICFFYEKEKCKDKSHGIQYMLYSWKKYLVMRGTHRVFSQRNYKDVNWYKYTKPPLELDYKNIPIKRFVFLDKKALTKHLVEDLEKESEAHGVHQHHSDELKNP